MGIAEVQAAQARLYTNAVERTEFYRDPTATGSRWGLNVAETEQLLTVPRSQIEGFAKSLIAKRRNEIAKILPLTRKALGIHFADLFQKHADQFTRQGAHRHIEDAMAFAVDLSRGKYRAETPQFVCDLARLEAACIAVFQSGRPKFILLHSDVRKFVFSSENEPSSNLQTIRWTLIWPTKNTLRFFSGRIK